KGRIVAGELADLALLTGDYFSVPEDEIAHLSSVLTILGGEVVHGEGDFAKLAPPLPPPAPDWSPVRLFGGYQDRKAGQLQRNAIAACGCAHECAVHGNHHADAWTSQLPVSDSRSFWGALGCAC